MRNKSISLISLALSGLLLIFISACSEPEKEIYLANYTGGTYICYDIPEEYGNNVKGFEFFLQNTIENYESASYAITVFLGYPSYPNNDDYLSEITDMNETEIEAVCKEQNLSKRYFYYWYRNMAFLKEMKLDVETAQISTIIASVTVKYGSWNEFLEYGLPLLKRLSLNEKRKTVVVDLSLGYVPTLSNV